MANLPIRNLGSVGVNTDMDPFNLPLNGFSRGKNVRFADGNVEHGPIYREIETLSFTPAFVMGLTQIGTYDTMVIVDSSYNVHEYENGLLVQRYTEPTPSSLVSGITGTSLANVEYVNRPDKKPLSRTPSQSNFQVLPNWDVSWSCSAIRSFGDFMLALGMTEGGIEYPNRVRFSDLTPANQVPGSWDAADPTTSAGFNDLVQMETPLLDGQTLGSNFLLYSSDQVWQMEFVGGNFIFNFRKLFDDAGIINRNCVVEVEGKHYVFDNNDIYVTDGVSRQSICYQRTRDYIFSGMDTSKKDICYVHHNHQLEEIYFCYHSGDDMAVYADGDYCNRAAVYNYKTDTWSFMDLPNTVSGSQGNVNTVSSYANIPATLTYANAGGSFFGQDSQFGQSPVCVSIQDTGEGITQHRLLGIDLIDKGTLSKAAVDEIKPTMFIERVGVDLDELQVQLSGHKVVRGMYPQVSTVAADKVMEWTFGGAQVPNQAPNYQDPISFDIDTDYKVDTRVSGRYLSYKIATPQEKDFSLSGFDLDVVVTGRR